jgi:alpha-beta hydrolase superfamily lysophospholipase
MGTEVAYSSENVGDWGTPQAAAGGVYGTDTLAMADGTKVFFRYWRAADATAPVVVYLHGLGAHTGWFIDLGNELNARGLTVYMDDHRAFGRSEGPRGHVQHGIVYVEDIQRFLAHVREQHPDAPLFLAGHSMGGIFAIYTAAADAAREQSLLSGLILLNPWIKDAIKVKPAALLRVVTGGMRGSERLFMRKPSTDEMTLIPDAVRMLNDDTYWVRNQSESFLYQVTLLRSRVLAQARKVRTPALVIQTEGDATLVQAATRKCYEQLGSKDKTWKTYPNFAHDFEFEPGRSVLDDDIADWIMRHKPQA